MKKKNKKLEEYKKEQRTVEEKEGTDIPFNFDIASSLVFDEKKWLDQVSVTTLFINI